MASKFTYDTVNKLFILNSGVTSLDTKVDLYSDAKEDWETDLSLNKFRFPIRAIAGNEIDANTGKVISPYYELLYGWRIRPAEENTAFNVVGQVFTTEGDNAFVPTLGSFNVFIQYTVGENSSASVLDGGGLTPGESAILTQINTLVEEVHRLRGLDAANPVTHTPTQITAGDITIDLTGDGISSATSTRQ